MNKKGSILDVPIILVLIFIAAICGIVILKMFTTVADSISADPSISANTRSSMSTASTQMPGVFDFLLVMVFIGLPLASAFLAYFTDTNQILFYASLGLILIIIIIGATLQQVWETAMTNSSFAGMTATLPMTSYIVGHMGLYSFFVFLIIAAATFIRIRGEGA